MLIPIGTDYTHTTCGSTIKTIECENCHQIYQYEMKRRAHGDSTSLLFMDDAGAQHRAVDDAESTLLLRLATDCDAVPCPGCGWYQRNMFARVRRRHRPTMRSAGLVLLIVAVVAAITALIGSLSKMPKLGIFLIALAGVSFAAGIALLIVRAYLNLNYDPNSEDAETRKDLGRARALQIIVQTEVATAGSAVAIVDGLQYLLPSVRRARPMPQLVGNKCAACDKRISSITEGKFCEQCDSPVHDACVRQPFAGQEQNSCAACGCALANPQRLQVAQAMPTGPQHEHALPGIGQLVGGIILLAGIALLIGNITGAFRTFPFAGFLTMTVGGLMMAASRRS